MAGATEKTPIAPGARPDAENVAPPGPPASRAGSRGRIHPGARGHSGRTGGDWDQPLRYQAVWSKDSKGPETHERTARPMGRDEQGHPSSFPQADER